jgi:hypothetical protein
MPSVPVGSDLVTPLQAQSVDEALYWTVVYADIFDFPLTRDELFTFLVAFNGSRAEVDAALERVLVDERGLETDGRFVFLQGRAGTVARRLGRSRSAASLWRYARIYARLIWAIPYVRMVAVTGALAMDNVEPDADIDFLIVTEPGRLWLTRGMIVLLCKLARIPGHSLCPNYLISAGALRLDEQDLYAAHELAQMVPLHGKSVAQRLWTENTWCQGFLPNAQLRSGGGTEDGLARLTAAFKVFGERLLRSRPGDMIERWERERKIARLSRRVPPNVSETLFTAEVCKGHDRGHGSRITRVFTSRLAGGGESAEHAAFTSTEQREAVDFRSTVAVRMIGERLDSQ